VLVGEERVAAFARQFLRMQQRAEAGLGLVRDVRVPVDARVAQTDGLAVLLDVGDDQDLGVVLQLELVQHVDLERAEAAAEIDVLGGRDLLVAEHQHVVIEVRAVDAHSVWLRSPSAKPIASQGVADREADHLEQLAHLVLVDQARRHRALGHGPCSIRSPAARS
jgi:hypothetical protein